MTARAALLALALGCSGSHAPRCTDVADHARSLFQLLGSAGEPVRVMVERRCEDDRWSAEARACMLAAPQRAALFACRAQLTPAQATAFAADLDRVVSATAGTLVAPQPPASGDGSTAP